MQVPAALMFDLHNRFTVPPAGADPAQSFTRHTAVVAVVKPTGEADRAGGCQPRVPHDLGSVRSNRRAARGSAPKIVAPGQAQAIRVEIPAGVTASASSARGWKSGARPAGARSTIRTSRSRW
jgi:hypothetical protein